MYLRCLTFVNGILTLTLGFWWLCSNGASSAENKFDSMAQRVHPLTLTIESQNGELPNKSGPDQSLRIEDGTTKREPRLECYVCSWSIMGMGSGNASENIDTCSTGKFMEDGTSVTPCEYGCRTVSFKNSEKEEISHFYRNCWKVDQGKELVDRCYKSKTMYGLEQICECGSNLCNTSPSIHLTIWNNIQFIVFSTLTMTLHFNLFE